MSLSPFLLLLRSLSYFFLFFFFNDTATTEIYTLSLHDALPISPRPARDRWRPRGSGRSARRDTGRSGRRAVAAGRSEEHTSELQSRSDLVCRLLLEKKKKKHTTIRYPHLDMMHVWVADDRVFHS